MAAWIWFGIFGVPTNLAAVLLLWAALHTRLVPRLQQLRRRALVGAALSMFGAGLGLLIGLVTALGAVGGESLDPSQRARILAEDTSDAVHWLASAFVMAPIPIAVVIAITVRKQRARAP